MTPKIETLPEKILIGKRITMSLSENKTGEVWRSFMPHRHEIVNTVSKDLISAQIYPDRYFSDFSVANKFEKWAAAEVSDAQHIPTGMESLVINGGLYAVFQYKGLSGDSKIFQDIFGTWLPDSIYLLDDRPHFEILGERYKNNDPSSEEEIWIPIKPKQ